MMSGGVRNGFGKIAAIMVVSVMEMFRGSTWAGVVGEESSRPSSALVTCSSSGG